MKKMIWLLVPLFSATASEAQVSKNFIDRPYIEVAGAADTLVMPDEIFIRIIISEKDTRDRVSVEDQETKMVAALQGIGIDTEKELSANDLASNFRNYLLKGREVVKTKQYQLKVRDAATAGKVFMELEKLEISNVSIERVDHSQKKQLAHIMRLRAMEDAKESAVLLVKPLNQLVGQAIHISEGSSQQFDGPLQGKVAGIQIRGTNARFSTASEPKIEFEKIRITGAVHVKFILQ